MATENDPTPVGATSDNPHPDQSAPAVTAPKAVAKPKTKPKSRVPKLSRDRSSDVEDSEANLVKAEEANAKAEQARLNALNSTGAVDFSSQPAKLGEDPDSKLPRAYTSEHFAVVHSDYFGNELVTINPRGWVGEDALKISYSNLKELKELLGKL